MFQPLRFYHCCNFAKGVNCCFCNICKIETFFCGFSKMRVACVVVWENENFNSCFEFLVLPNYHVFHVFFFYVMLVFVSSRCSIVSSVDVVSWMYVSAACE